MKKLIVALLLCLVPFESNASSRADRYRPKVYPELAQEIIDHIANSTADSVDSLNKSLDWLDNKQQELIFMHCITGRHNGKPYNKNFCEKISESTAAKYFVGKIENILMENKYPYPYDRLLIDWVHYYMNSFFEEDQDNIVIKQGHYIEPDEPTITNNILQIASELLGLFR